MNSSGFPFVLDYGIWHGHDPTTMLGSIFYYSRLNISEITLRFIKEEHRHLCRWCHTLFTKMYGIDELRLYCSKECKRLSRNAIVRKSKSKTRDI